MKKIKHLLSSRKLFAAVLTIALLASLIPLGIVLGNNAGAINPDYVENGYGVNEDNNTVEPETIVPGQVWTDKVVTPVVASPFDGVFNVELKAVGGEISTSTSQAADIVFVLDRSTSMRNQDYSLMVDAVNESIKTIMESNTANKVAVVCFGSTANTLLGLGRYTSTNDSYLTYGSSTLAVSGTVSIESGSGGTIGSSIDTGDTNYTNIQAGLISAYNILNATGSNVPAIVLMSDGGASKYTTIYDTFNISNASSWTQSSNYDDDDQFAHTAAYYTIRTANNIKSLLGAGSMIYTIGYNLGSNNKVATATLNPTPANITATAALLSDWQDTLSEQLGTSNYQYNNDYYTGSNTSGLTAAMLSAVGEIIDSSSPILGDLIFTDNIGAGFGFITETDNTIAFRFDGDTEDRYAVKNATENRYEYTDPVTNISVVFDAGVPMQVRYTIPAAALRLATYDDDSKICNVGTFNTLDFKVRLSDSVTTEPTDTYYTNNGCKAVFSPALNNPYFGFVAEHTDTTDSGSENYVNTPKVDGTWNTTPSATYAGSQIINPTSDAAFTGESFTMTTATFRGYTFMVDASDISAPLSDSGGRYYNITVDTPIEEAGPPKVKVVPNITFKYYPLTQSFQGFNSSDTIRVYNWIDAYWNVTNTDNDLNDQLSNNSGEWSTNGLKGTMTKIHVKTPSSWGLPGNTIEFDVNATNISRVWSGQYNAYYYPIDVEQTKTITVSGTQYQIAADFSFRYVPSASGNEKYRKEDGSITKASNVEATWATSPTNTYSAGSLTAPTAPSSNASYTAQGLTMTNVTFNGYTFTVNPTDITGPHASGTYYSITVNTPIEVAGSPKIVPSISFRYYPATSTYSEYTGTGDSINVYNWIPEEASVTTFNVDTAPTAGNSYWAQVTVNPGQLGEATYAGTATVTSPNQWSFTQTAVNGDVTKVYTITLADANHLTVSFEETTRYDAFWENENVDSEGQVTQLLTETGWIKLAHADGSLRVEKQVAGYVGSQEFSFTVELEDEATTATLYKYVSDGNYTPSELTAAGNSYSFSLADNDYAVFTELSHEADYTITETPDGAFDTTISSSNTTVTANANGVFQGAIIGGPTTNKVTFTNTYKVGALTIGKTVFQDAEIVEEPEFALAAVSTPGYAFQVVLTLPSGITYQDISYDGDVVTKATDSLTFTFSLGNGDYVTLGNIPEGTQYTVTETSSDDAVVYYSVNSASYTEGKAATGNVTSNEDSVQFVNNYLTPAPLTILKNVTETDIYPLAPDSFDFEIFFYNLEKELLDAEAAAKETYNTAQGNLDSALLTLQDNADDLASALGDDYDSDSDLTVAEQAIALLGQAESNYNTAVAEAMAAHPDEEPPYDPDTDPNVIAAKETWDDLEAALRPLLTAYDASYNDIYEADGLQDLRDAAYNAYMLAQAAVIEEPYTLSTDEIPLSPQLTAIDGDGNEGRYTFTLAAGGSISFTNLPIGLYYRITETTTGAKTTITNSQKTDDNLDLTTEGQIVWNYEDVDDNENNAITVVYTNDFSISFGSLSLTKDFDDSTAFWKLPQDGNFTFDITIGETIYEDVALNSENGYSKTYSDLIPGTTYSIEETTPGTYTTNAPFSGTIQASGQWGTEEVTLECVNTYEPPVNVTKTVNNDSVTTGTTVTYTGTVTYENPYDVTSIVLTDLRFSAIPDSFTLTSLGSAELDPNWDGEEGEDALVWNSTHDQLEIHLQPQQMEEPSASDTNTITFTYQVRFNSAGEYDNTVTADVIYYREISFNDSASASVTVTDPYTPPPYNPPPVIITSDPEYGTLTVVKNVTGENAPTDVSFNITVQFSGTLNTILYNGTNNADGLYTLSLAAGQSGTFTNIPLNTTFAVTEALTVDQSDGGWMAPAEDIEGIINSTTPVTVSVNNVYDAGLQGDVDVDEELEPETETGVAGDAEKDDILPQTGGISSSTLLGIFGLALIAIGGAVFMAMRRKFVGKSKSK